MAYISGLVLACVFGSGAIMAQPPASAEAEPPALAESLSPDTVVVQPEAAIPLGIWAKNLLHDQKPVWTLPGKVARGKHWKPDLGVIIGTTALVVLDPHTEPYFHNQSRFGSYKTGPLRGRNTTLAVTLTPVAFYLAGLAKQSTYTRNTGLLAAEGLVGTQVVSFVMKQAVGRLKPSDIPEGGNLRDTWFKYKGGLSNGGGFPSGHTASAFAVATVIAERYHEHRWVPWAAYGTALVLSLSRLPAQAHFSSDIFIGAAMGYSFSHFVVLRK
jgi:hypothetical protein